MSDEKGIKRLSQLFVGVSPHIFEVQGLRVRFPRKLYGTIHSECNKSFSRFDIRFSAFRALY